MSIVNLLNPADYNPRTISDEKLEELRASLLEFGDLSGIVFNVRTKHLVTGHQRLKAIPKDAEIEKTACTDSMGTVATGFIQLKNGERYQYREVDWDLDREKVANVTANRQFGDFDPLKLEALVRELKTDFGSFEAIDLTSFVEEKGIRDIAIEPQIDPKLLEPRGTRNFRRVKREGAIRFGEHEIRLLPESFDMWLTSIMEEAEERQLHVIDLLKSKLGIQNDRADQSDTNQAVDL